MRTRILRGRGIGEKDVAGAPGAVVVSESMANLARRAARVDANVALRSE